ncbi:hypothetical protein YM304_39780 [Ilumatobacter coccineus YM16-304]|uniref:DUF427 domain-containing protein n=2 Tax=Ilumatobacter coccineus TaxID=467094 RepID=A0A6C7EEC5_ILUCY|nr:hypothetical protein YM304_39780 [Ilumatobacter coccineus YM16-304]
MGVPVGPTMTQGHTITTHAEDVHVEVRLDGEVVASAQRPVLLEETGLPTTYYIPKSDLVVEARPIELSTHCPFKGDASYWTIDAGGRTHDAIAWSYEQPKEGAEEIAGHVAFFANRAEILVDGSPA